MDAEERDRINEQMKARQYELSAKLPISWKSKSLDLKHAADILFDHHHDATQRIIDRAIKEKKHRKKLDGSRTLEGSELKDHQDSQLIGVYFLLIGYAIENLLKGNLLVQHPEYFKPDKKMTDIKTHKLTELCIWCNISLMEEEIVLLNKLTRYVEWQGKYPIPLELDEMFPIKKDDGTWETRGISFKGIKKLQQEIDDLYAKLWFELENQSKQAYEEKKYLNEIE